MGSYYEPPVAPKKGDSRNNERNKAVWYEREVNFFKGVFFLQQEIEGGGVLFKQKVSEGLFNLNTKLEHCGHDNEKFGGDN